MTNENLPGRIVEIEEILAGEKIVLVDANIKGSHGIFTELRKPGAYLSLDRKKVRREMDDLRTFIELMQHPSTATTSDVIREIGEYERILKDEARKVCSSDINANHMDDSRGDLKRMNKVTRLVRSMEDLVDEIHLILPQKDVRRLIQVDERRSYLIAMIKILDQQLGLKQDTELLYGRHNEDHSHTSDTDEKLVAMAYYLSMFTNKTPVVLTSDGDFPRLLGVATRILGSEVFLPHNQGFRQAYEKNPFELYLKRNGVYTASLETPRIVFDKHFIIGGVDSQKQEEMRAEIGNLWEMFTSTEQRESAS